MAKFFTHSDLIITVGDTIKVHQEVLEGDKKRIQGFEGLVLAVNNRGAGQSFTVRKIATGGIGVEKIFPVQLPSITKIEIKRTGLVKRGKLYYLRERVGKQAIKVKEKKSLASATTVA